MKQLTDKEFFEVQEIRNNRNKNKKPYRVYVREGAKVKITFLGCYKTVEAAKKRIDEMRELYKKNRFDGVLWIENEGEVS